MQKRLVTTYAMKSAGAADDNRQRIEAVLSALAADAPGNVRITSTPAFTHFQQDHAERRLGDVEQQTAELVGAYVTTIA
jgi:hypothetical protein